jgi:hypothetical protein
MGLRPVAARGTSPPPGRAGLCQALRTRASRSGPVPAAVEAHQAWPMSRSPALGGSRLPPSALSSAVARSVQRPCPSPKGGPALTLQNRRDVVGKLRRARPRDRRRAAPPELFPALGRARAQGLLRGVGVAPHAAENAVPPVVRPAPTVGARSSGQTGLCTGVRRRPRDPHVLAAACFRVVLMGRVGPVLTRGEPVRS